MDQKTFKLLFKEIQAIKAQMLTKEDAKQFATKDDLLILQNEIRETKDEVKQTKDEIKQTTTELKEAIKDTKRELLDEIKNVEVDVTANLERGKAARSTVDNLDKRVTKLEKRVFN